MDRQAAISALNRGMPLAAELACANPQRRAWVGVYPLELSSENTRQFLRSVGVDLLPKAGRAYHVRSFEVDRTVGVKDVWIAEADLQNKRSSVASSDDDLCELLKAFGSSVESLEPHHKSDYPL